MACTALGASNVSNLKNLFSADDPHTGSQPQQYHLL